ncbi:MAG: hypothetical protein J7497_15710, partial [Chitinophagaceae bacterium]|nr:hypothetical protein [Chitinophagaceae bacterium]
IVGDHGMSTIHTIFRPNLFIKDVPAKFTAAGGSAFLYRQPGATEDNSLIIKKVVDQLNKLPKDKRKLFRIINRAELDKMGADSTAIMALAAVPGIVFSGATTASKTINQGPGTSIQQNPLQGIFVPTTGGHHGYDPNDPEMYTGFIASGAGINKGGRIKELCVTDLAPLIAELLHFEFTCPDGKLPENIANKLP